MTAEERQTLIALQHSKALRFLKDADDMVEQQRWDLAANRYYYACFHAVQSLFIKDGLSAHKHSSLVNLFSQHYVKTGKASIHYGGFLARMMQLRQKADYNCYYDIDEKDVKEIVSLSHDFIAMISSLIGID